jgi:hypothetical protein
MPQKKPTVYEFIPELGQLRDDVLTRLRALRQFDLGCPGSIRSPEIALHPSGRS